nr:hypothetical protein [Tanacetum cinerariifolium]
AGGAGRGHYAATSGGQPLRERAGAGPAGGLAGEHRGRGQQLRRCHVAAGGWAHPVWQRGGSQQRGGPAASAATAGPAASPKS